MPVMAFQCIDNFRLRGTAQIVAAKQLFDLLIDLGLHKRVSLVQHHKSALAVPDSRIAAAPGRS
jgi:hypothetical protein